MQPVSSSSHELGVSSSFRNSQPSWRWPWGRLACLPNFCFGRRPRFVSDALPVGDPDGGTSCEVVYGDTESVKKTMSTEMYDEALEGHAADDKVPLSGGLRLDDGMAYSQIKRNRRVNEDSYLFESRKLADGSRVSLIGVFDGHGNEQLSQWLSVHFPDIFYRVFRILQNSFSVHSVQECVAYTKKLFPSEGSYKSRLVRILSLNCVDFISLSLCVALAICDERAMTLATVDTAHGGSCATVVAVVDCGIFMATIGDSSVALVGYDSEITNCDYSILLRTSDHRPSCRPDEVLRVKAAGGSIYKNNAVGMAFSSLNVTRSMGDTLWRANDDWGRDKTTDPSDRKTTTTTSSPLVLDKSITDFSKQKGCVGIISDPEWYSCYLHTDDQNEYRWDIKSNCKDPKLSDYLSSESDGMTVVPASFKFLLVAGSDGFWETQAFSQILNETKFSNPTAAHLVEIAQSYIGLHPHDDATMVLATMALDPPPLQVGRDAAAAMQVRRHRSLDDNNKVATKPEPRTLDYLFS